ncbi:MAG: General stress protein 16U [Candidatus Ordinivivax streblomastigis]|uniref:General stress protein 16U n=1 Tax=Candidatus Ordinivivax streblomastigis TaxID=2540710 RepID=A0A5M8NUC3_9BACT|nr:MAG: General stress protein 16U [Candidatus Ordinivivax streblomastigis]
MAINLTKGQRIEIGLSKVGVGLGWDPNEGTGFDFDLDASAFMLGENKKLPQDDFFVFYNNPKSPDDAVESSGDDTTGGSSDGDDETLTVDLAKVSPRIKEIIFTVTIHDFETRKQNFGQIRNSFIRIYNADTNEEIAKYELDEDFSVETAVEFGRLYKRGSEWKFEAMGIGYRGGLQHFVDKYA